MVVYSAAFTSSLVLVDPFTRLMFGTAPPAAGFAAGGGAASAWLDRLPSAWHHWLFEADRLVAFERLCAVILVLFLVKNLADYFASYLSVAVEQAAMRDLRRDVFSHLSHLSLDFYHGRRSGALISRLTNDVEALRSTHRGEHQQPAQGRAHAPRLASRSCSWRRGGSRSSRWSSCRRPRSRWS